MTEDQLGADMAPRPIRIPKRPRRRMHVDNQLPDDAPETPIRVQIHAWLNRLPWCKLWRNNTGVLRDSRGVPVTYGLAVGSADLVGLIGPGRFIAIEVKRPRKTALPHQEEWLAEVRRLGGIAFVATSLTTAIEGLAHYSDRRVKAIRDELTLRAGKEPPP